MEDREIYSMILNDIQVEMMKKVKKEAYISFADRETELFLFRNELISRSNHPRNAHMVLTEVGELCLKSATESRGSNND